MQYEILRVDVPNENGRIYTREVIEAAIDRAKFPIPGTIGMVFDIAPISQSHVTNQIWIEPDGRVMADIKILENPIGRSLRQLLEPVHDHFTFRIAGTGDLVDGKIANFNFNSINLVLDGA
jgi:hypothetical protein